MSFITLNGDHLNMTFHSPALVPLSFLPSLRWHVNSKQHRILTTDMVSLRHFGNSFEPTLLPQMMRTVGEMQVM